MNIAQLGKPSGPVEPKLVRGHWFYCGKGLTSTGFANIYQHIRAATFANKLTNLCQHHSEQQFMGGASHIAARWVR